MTKLLSVYFLNQMRFFRHYLTFDFEIETSVRLIFKVIEQIVLMSFIFYWILLDPHSEYHTKS